MNLAPRLRTVVGGFLLLGAAAALLHAEGSPPLITDDPGTPGDGHWEINLGISTEKRPGSRFSELPLIDVNYGIGDRLQLKYEVPYLRLTEDGASPESGLGNSAFGVKWRFYDAGEKGLSVSVYPQVEFNTPGTNSEGQGLVEPGTVFVLPFQFEREAGPVTLIWQVGREFRPDGDAWFYGISAGHHFAEKVEVAVELAGAGSARLDRTQLTADLGVTVELSDRSSVMFSLGRELHNHAEPRASLVGYLGMQWRL